MATPLNIKDPSAYQLATEIAEVTGKSLTRVVVDSLQHEKERLLQERRIDVKRFVKLSRA